MSSANGMKMKCFEILLVVASHILTYFVRGQSIITSPADTTETVGDQAEFACHVELKSQRTLVWKFNDIIIYAYLGGIEEYPFPDKNKYQVEKKEYNFTLTVNDLMLKDGGKYTCIAGIFEEATAVLIVLGKPSLILPKSTPVEGDVVEYICQAKFGGPQIKDISPSHYPQLKIFVNDDWSLNETETTNMDNYYLLQQVNYIKIEANMHGQLLTCQIETVSPAHNASTSTVMSILYSVRTTTYSPYRDKYDIGDNITCVANGNPEPSYEWQNELSPDSPVVGQWLHVAQTMVGQNKWKCIARNVINGKTYEETVTAAFEAIDDTLITTDPPPEDKGYITPTVLGIAFSLLTTTGICTIIILYWKKNNSAKIFYTKFEMIPKTQLLDGQDNLEDATLARTSSIQTLTESQEPPHPRERNIAYTKIISRLQGNKNLYESWNMSANDERTIPELFLEAIRKASHLLMLDNYMEFIKEMGKLYSKMANKPKEGPLQCVLQLLSNDRERDIIFQHQSKMLELFQILIETDNNEHSRTEFLRGLILHSEFISEKVNAIRWSEELFSILKLLLEKGADSTWIPPTHLQESQRFDRYTIQYKLFLMARNILGSKNHLANTLMEVLTLFSSQKCLNNEHVRGTILHALVEPDWEWFNMHFGKQQIFKQYMQIMEQVVNCYPEFTKVTNWFGESPLQFFIKGIKLQENIIEQVETITNLLRTSDSITMHNNQHQTVLHYLCEAFPLFVTPPDSTNKNKVVSFVRNLVPDIDLAVQDVHGSTSLHILMEKYSKDMSENYMFKTLFTSFCKIFITVRNRDIQDEQMHAALHILVNKFPQEVSKSGEYEFHSVVKELSSKSNAEIQDLNKRTVLHIIAENYNKDIPEHCQEIFPKLLKCCVTEYNVDIEDSEGLTVLHVLGNKYPAEVPEHGLQTYLDVMKHLASYSSICIQDPHGNTALHLIAKNDIRRLWGGYQEIYKELILRMANSSNINIQDKQGCNCLHYIFKNIIFIPSLAQKFISKMDQITSPENINCKDTFSITPYSWILKGNKMYENEENETKQIFLNIDEICQGKGANHKYGMDGLYHMDYILKLK